jgi:pimeloyl-ACP methyl ester carboxylesterase
MPEELQIRVHEAASFQGGSPPTLVYLPGLHGDWTLIGPLRRALAGRVRFVELTYPRTLTWSLEDYAAAIENKLAEHGITGGWLLAESFGSQVLWPLLGRKRFGAQGAILAGGFVRHPALWLVRVAIRVAGNLPLKALIRILFGYAFVARLRHYRDPEHHAALEEFLARRTELDRRAAQHRLALIACNDPCPIAGNTNVPIYAITGLFDPIVPWFPVKRWLKRYCPALKDWQMVSRSDHNVLTNAALKSSALILEWMNVERRPKTD